jgi:hypothetical protein
MDGETHTVTIRSAELRALLGDVQRAASGDRTMPMLNGVLLHTDTHPRLGHVLVASATDRYVAVQGCAEAQGTLPGRVFLPLRQITQILSVTRPYTTRNRAADAQTEIAVADGQVTVRQLALPVHDLGAVTVTFPAGHGHNFPDIGQLWKRDVEPAADPVSLSGAALALLGRLATGREPVRIMFRGSSRTVVAHVGDRLSVLVMPVRTSETVLGPTFFDIPKTAEKAEERAA